MPEGPSLVIAKEAMLSFKGKKLVAVSGNTKIGKEQETCYSHLPEKLRRLGTGIITGRCRNMVRGQTTRLVAGSESRS